MPKGLPRKPTKKKKLKKGPLLKGKAPYRKNRTDHLQETLGKRSVQEEWISRGGALHRGFSLARRQTNLGKRSDIALSLKKNVLSGSGKQLRTDEKHPLRQREPQIAVRKKVGM